MLDQIRIDAAALDDVFERFNRRDAPGLTIGIALRGSPLYRRGFGLASLELPVALTPTMRLRIGSVSKHFCSLAIMLLAEDGALCADDSPRKFLPELPEWAAAITLRQLMSHTSGMRCSLDLILHFNGGGRPVPGGAQVDLLKGQDSVNFPPGTSWNYCNGGYVLLTALVERITGKPLGDVLRERIFEPVGMYDTLLRPYDNDFLPNSASLHYPRPDGGFVRDSFGPPLGGEGGIVSTVDDMLVWLKHMSNPVVGSRVTWDAMRTPLAPHGYGLGLFVGDYRGARIVHHAGSLIGGACQMLKVVDHELDIIVMTNRSGLIDPSALAEGIIDACVPNLASKVENVAAQRALVATFYSKRSGICVRLLDDGGKQVADFLGARVPVRRDVNGALWLEAVTTDACLTPSFEDDEPATFRFTEFGVTEKLARVEPPSDADSVSVRGRYACPAAFATATVTPEKAGEGRLHLRGVWGEIGYRLELIGPALWSVSTGNPLAPLGGIIEFDDDDGFRFSSVRTRRLKFSREA